MEQKLGKYIIEEELGEGSFAYVYRARDEDLDRQIALKVLKAAWLSDPSAIVRFKQEARTMAKLDKNPHIAVVYEVGEAEGQVYLTQLLVDGETLGQRLARLGSMPWSEIIGILRDVASALDYAHSQGVIHRDIKPSNILLDREGHTYLADFGLVRAAEGSESLSASIGGVKGTAAYIPPEVWDGEKATPASDVYALSCVISEMLTGQVLFEGSSMMAVMRKHDKGPQFPEAWPEGVPAGVTDVLQRGLTANPGQRFQSVGELLAALESLSAEPAAVPATAPPPSTQTVPEGMAPAAPPPQPVSQTAATGTGVSKGLLLGGGVALVAIVGALFFLAFLLFFAFGDGDATEAASTKAAPAVVVSHTPRAVKVVNTEVPTQIPTATPASDANAIATSQAAASATARAKERATEISERTATDVAIATATGAPRATATAQAKATEVSARTATDVAKATATALANVTPTVPPGSQQGILFQDDFSSDVNNWHKGDSWSNGFSEHEVVGGVYKMSVETNSGGSGFSRAGIPDSTLEDFLLTVDATLVETSAKANKYYVIIGFRRQDGDNLYQVQFDNDAFAVKVEVDGSIENLSGWIRSDAIRLVEGVQNSFGVLVQGSALTIYANGQELTTITDTTFSEGNRQIGLGLFSDEDQAGDHHVVVEFDNLVIRQP